MGEDGRTGGAEVLAASEAIETASAVGLPPLPDPPEEER
jgi:hypothetical protein